jgi:hypothetical protein
MKKNRAVVVTRTAIRSIDNIGRIYVMLFRHFFDAQTGMKVGCKGRTVGCKSAEEAEQVMDMHRKFGAFPTTH